MTMKPNTELNTMMFFDDALESERTYLLTELADAVSETRTAADQAAELNEDGEAGWQLLEAAAKKRGFLAGRGEYDTERMSAVLLDEFRGGKLGRMTLEAPDEA